MTAFRLMDALAIIQHLVERFAAVQVVTSKGNSFFYYSTDGKIPERTFPFATLVTTDDYDQFSNLSRPGVFRLNVGVGRNTFRELFPPGEFAGESGSDFTELDRLTPHPVYGAMHWVCVLNPSDAAWPTTQTLLAEAYARAVKKHAGSSSDEAPDA